MGHLALLAAAGTIALFSWGWFDRVLQFVWPGYEPRVEATATPEPSAMPVSEDDVLEGELRALDDELDSLQDKGAQELNDLGEGL